MIFTGAEWAALGVVASLIGTAVFIALNRSAASRERVQAVVDEYVRLAYGHPVLDPGLRGFIRAGARTLQGDGEIRAALTTIVARYRGVGRLPFGTATEELMAQVDDLEEFLEEMGANADNFGPTVNRYIGGDDDG